MLRDGKSGVVTGFRAMGDARASPDAPLQQVPRAERSAAEAEGGGGVEGSSAHASATTYCLAVPEVGR